jgi:hypothetical protein
MGLMPAAGGNPFDALTKQGVIGHFKATNSHDKDVLFAQKMHLITQRNTSSCLVGSASSVALFSP